MKIESFPSVVANNVWERFKDDIHERIQNDIDVGFPTKEEDIWDDVYVEDEANGELNLEQAVYVVKVALGADVGIHVEDLIGQMVIDEIQTFLKEAI